MSWFCLFVYAVVNYIFLVLSKHLFVVEKWGSTSFGFAQNTTHEHDFENTVFNSQWHCLRQMPQKLWRINTKDVLRNNCLHIILQFCISHTKVFIIENFSVMSVLWLILLTLYHTPGLLMTGKKKPFEKLLKEEKMQVTSIFSFSHNLFYHSH